MKCTAPRDRSPHNHELILLRLNEGRPSVSGMPRLFVFLMVVAACGGNAVDGGEEPAAKSTSTTATLASGTSTTSADDTTRTTDAPPDTTTTTSDRPVAPDFTLELGNGGAYTLSTGEKPVYLVFWAEW